MSNIQEVNMFAVTPAIEQVWEQQAQNIKETRTKEEAVEYLEYERTVARVKRAFLLSDGYVMGAGAISSECYEKYINYLTALIQSKETEQEKKKNDDTLQRLADAHKIKSVESRQCFGGTGAGIIAVARFIADELHREVTKPILKDYCFITPKGEPYGDDRIEQAVTDANKPPEMR